MADEKKKITISKAKDELISAALITLGLAGGSAIMKLAGPKLPSPWITPAVAFATGLGLRIFMDDENVKDIAGGVMVAGAADGLKKGFTLLLQKVPALAAFVDPINSYIPQLSGPSYQPIADSLRGGFADAQVMESTLATSLR